MARFLFVALLCLIAAPAVGQSTPKGHAWRIRELPVTPRAAMSPGAAIGSTSRIGIGMFGLKSRAPLQPVTVEEVTAPKSRHAGIGWSLKF